VFDLRRISNGRERERERGVSECGWHEACAREQGAREQHHIPSSSCTANGTRPAPWYTRSQARRPVRRAPASCAAVVVVVVVVVVVGCGGVARDIRSMCPGPPSIGRARCGSVGPVETAARMTRKASGEVTNRVRLPVQRGVRCVFVGARVMYS
jgi:hypothetical protein